jgi:hypothetical protein
MLSDTAPGSCLTADLDPVVALLRSLLDSRDQDWLRGQPHCAKSTLAEFHATRRRTLYRCVRTVWRLSRHAQRHWAAAAERAADFRGADMPFESAKLAMALAGAVAAWELRMTLGLPAPAPLVQRLSGWLGALPSRMPVVNPAT